MNAFLVHPPDGEDRWIIRVDWVLDGARKVGVADNGTVLYVLERKLTATEKERIGILGKN